MQAALKAQVGHFLAALQYFTRIPLTAWTDHSAARLTGASHYLPAIGILVGGLAAVVYVLARLAWPPNVAIILAMAATVLATGALHEDGLADACDGFGGGFDRERTLAIMKDSRIGSFGAIALTLALLVKFQSLVALPTARVGAALVGGHAISRLAAFGMLTAMPYVRDEASARAAPLATRPAAWPALFAVFVGLAPLFWLGRPGLLGLASSIAAALLWARFINGRIGGYTGDCLGAGQQLTEIAFYLGLLAGAK